MLLKVNIETDKFLMSFLEIHSSTFGKINCFGHSFGHEFFKFSKKETISKGGNQARKARQKKI